MTTAPRQNQYRGSAPDLGADSEFGRLVAAVCNGTLTRLDRDRLETLLADPAVRAAYRDQLRLHAHLVRLWHAGAAESQAGFDDSRAGGQTAAGVPSQNRRSHRSGERFAAAVAVVRATLAGWLRRLAQPLPIALFIAGSFVASALLVAASVRVPPADPALGEAMAFLPPAARMTGLFEPKWREGEARHDLFEALPAGTVLDLESGLAELRYDCGATVVLEGPATLRIEGRSESRLSRGRLTAKLEGGGQAHSKARANRGARLPRLFTIHTPKASVHDLGTEFGVEVRSSGDADVHVFDGLVELAKVSHPAVATATANEVPLRLAAGESVKIDEAGRIAASGAASSRRFVRSLPKAELDPRSLLERLGWSDAAAEVIYRDSFAGSGSIAGTSPASRGGIGAVAWAAPADWSLNAADGVAIATSPGTALLPFQPEPGWLYRISIDLDVFAGGPDWFVVGLTPAMRPDQLINSVAGAHAWMGQRHETNHAGAVGNFAFAGPGLSGLVMPIDMATGRQQRSILLDTRGRGWAAYLLRGDEPVARCAYPVPPGSLACVVLSQFGQARTRLHGFAVARVSAAAAAAIADRGSLERGTAEPAKELPR